MGMILIHGKCLLSYSPRITQELHLKGKKEKGYKNVYYS